MNTWAVRTITLFGSRREFSNRLLAMATAILTACAAHTPATTAKHEHVRSEQNELDQIFARYNNAKTPGVAVLVMQNGQVLHSSGYGYRSPGDNVSINSEHRFRLASVSKQFTAMAVAILEDRGKISHDDVISKFFPELPNWSNDITIGHLVHHMSGLPSYMKLCSNKPTSKMPTNDTVMEFLSKQPKLKFAPGSAHKYSNTGYVVLASLIERVTKQRFPDWVKNNIFKPAGIVNAAVFNESHPTVKNRVKGHGRWPYFGPKDYNSCNHIYGDGAFYLSLQDFAHWIRALENHTLVSPSKTKEIFAVTKTSSGDEVRYGYGWAITSYKGDIPLRIHDGAWLGFSTATIYFPEQRLWFVILANHQGLKLDPLLDLLAQTYLSPTRN